MFYLVYFMRLLNETKELHLQNLGDLLKSSPLQYEPLINYISKLKCPKTLRFVLQSIGSRLPKFEIPKNVDKKYQTNIDYISLAILRQSDMPYGDKIPLISKADGNCLFHSVSILLVGNLSMSQEIKVSSNFLIFSFNIILRIKIPLDLI